MDGPKAVLSAPVAGSARVFDLGGTPGRYLNSAEATDASASTLASQVMRARCGREKTGCRLQDWRCSVPVAGVLQFLSVSSQHLQNTSFGI